MWTNENRRVRELLEAAMRVVGGQHRPERHPAGIHDRQQDVKGDNAMEQRAKRQPKVTEAEQLRVFQETLARIANVEDITIALMRETWGNLIEPQFAWFCLAFGAMAGFAASGGVWPKDTNVPEFSVPELTAYLQYRAPETCSLAGAVRQYLREHGWHSERTA